MRIYTADEINDMKMLVFSVKTDMLMDDGENEEDATSMARHWVDGIENEIIIELFKAITK